MENKILIIDDDKELCILLKKYLETENFLVKVEHDGENGIKEALKESYTAIILDIMLPKKNGFEVLSEIRKSSVVPVLMLTAKDSEVDKVSGLRMGADDYLTKPFSMNEFVARVQALVRRYTIMSSIKEVKEDILEFSEISINPSTREVIRDGENLDLTAKEFDLIYLLAKNKGRVFTKKQIYSQVWQEEYAYDDNNIMVHIRRLRVKVEKDPKEPKYIQTVWGVGYKFSQEV